MFWHTLDFSNFQVIILPFFLNSKFPTHPLYVLAHSWSFQFSSYILPFQKKIPTYSQISYLSVKSSHFLVLNEVVGNYRPPPSPGESGKMVIPPGKLQHLLFHQIWTNAHEKNVRGNSAHVFKSLKSTSFQKSARRTLEFSHHYFLSIFDKIFKRYDHSSWKSLRLIPTSSFCVLERRWKFQLRFLFINFIINSER